MQRVIVIGCSGSGKSTLARKLAEKTGLPVIHLDREYWRPGWVEPDKVEWLATVNALIDRSRWIMDGNFGGSLPMRMAAADTVILLDLPRYVCLWSVIRRSIFWLGRKRVDMADGCNERIDPAFLLYVWRWRRNSRPRTLAALGNFHGKLVVLRSRKDVAAFIARFPEPGP
jgi:adenylate kinase family enzyme